MNPAVLDLYDSSQHRSWQNSSLEIFELLERHLGWNFQAYSVASLERQLLRVSRDLVGGSPGELLAWLRVHPYERGRLLRDALTVNVTDLFRDPLFFQDLKQSVFPYLSECPKIDIWVAGCATGEEAYSLAIMLSELGLLNRCRILATDLDWQSLKRARSGVLPRPLSRKEAERYRLSGGEASLLEYFGQSYGLAKLKQEYLSAIHFVQHGLPAPSPGPQVQLLLCRNVMIYFNNQLKQQVLSQFISTMAPQSFLCLGDKESIDSHPDELDLEMISRHRIYRRRSPFITAAS